jgi:hypothetical protein
MKRFNAGGIVSLGLLILIGALGVSSASASQFRSEEYPAQFKGEQSESARISLQTKAGKVKCSGLTFSGSETVASSALSVTPSYSGCTFVGLNTTAKVNSCHFVLHSTTEAPPYGGTMDVACAKESEKIEFTTPGGECSASIPPQTGLNSVQFSNSGKGHSRVILISVNLGGLKYSLQGFCGVSSGTFEDGSMAGSGTIKASSEAGQYALGAYVANEQVAEPSVFAAETYTSLIKGVAANNSAERLLLSLPALGSFNCKVSTLSGGLQASSSQIALTPGFGQCVYLGSEVFGHSNSCQVNVSLVSGGAPNAASTGVGCKKEGDAISFNWFGCEIRVGPQEWPKSAQFEGTGSGASRAIKLRDVVSGVKYVASGCPGGNGTFTNGKLEVTWQLSGWNAAGTEQQGLWIE